MKDGSGLMPHQVKKLSAILAGKLSSPGYYGDGLWLHISGSGSKSWVFRLTIAGKRREMGLGGLNAISLSLAREKARECRLLLTEAKDPIVHRHAAKTAGALSAARFKAFDQCAAAYIKAHRGSWKNAKHVAQWETSLRTTHRRCSGRFRCPTSIPTWWSKCCGRSGTPRPKRPCGYAAGSRTLSTGPPSAKYREAWAAGSGFHSGKTVFP
jgi:hypothetical protein